MMCAHGVPTVILRGCHCAGTQLLFYCSVDSLRPHGCNLQASLPSLSPGLCSNSCPIKSMMPSNYLILCHTVLLLSAVFPSTRVFSNELALCIRQPEYWSFSFSISPSNEYSGLIAFRMDWFDLRAVQGTLRSLLQHPHSGSLWPLLKSVFMKAQTAALVPVVSNSVVSDSLGPHGL